MLTQSTRQSNDEGFAICLPVIYPHPDIKPKGPHMEEIEEKMAHLIRTVDDLSDVVARQQTTIDQLEKRVHLLMQRAAQQEADQGSYIYTGPEKPPHY